MKRLAIFIILTSLVHAGQTPLQKYKLILSAQAGGEVIKQKLFGAILDDISRNQQRHIESLRRWDEKKVLEHYGARVTDPNTGLTEQPQDPELIRSRLIQGVHRRSKTIAREIWSKIDSKSLDEIKKDLGRTIKTEASHTAEAQETETKLKTDPATSGMPASPYYPGYYQGYYGNYAYNYLHNYGNYSAPYPYYYTNHYYQPVLSNSGSYNYQFGYYDNYHYQYRYYPRYNRTNRILATGIFGLAAVGAFVDWLRD